MKRRLVLLGFLMIGQFGLSGYLLRNQNHQLLSLKTNAQELHARIKQTKLKMGLLLETIQKIDITNKESISNLKTTFNQDIRGLARVEKAQKMFYLVKYVKDHPELFVKVKPNEFVHPNEQIPEIDQIKGWPALREIKNQTILRTKQAQFVLDQSFALAKVLFTIAKENLETLEIKENEIQHLRIDLKNLENEISGFQKIIQKKDQEITKKDQEIARLKEQLKKNKITNQSTIYVDKKTGNHIQTNATDLSNIQTEEIVAFGFYQDKFGVIRLPIMPKLVVRVPHYLPREITSLESAFENAVHFNQNLNYWDVSNVTNMASMFKGTIGFNNGKFGNGSNPLTFSGSTKNVTTMREMFFGAMSFNQDVSGLDISNVNNVTGMFKNCQSFNNGKRSLTWKNSFKNISSFQEMFSGAASFNQDISSWDVANVSITKSMFWGASSFNNGGRPLTWDSQTNKFTDMGNMFAFAENFNQDISNWDVSNVVNMLETFQNAKAFNKDLSRWNVANVLVMRRMFHEARSFNQNLSRWKVSQVKDHREFALGAGFANEPHKWPPFKKFLYFNQKS